MECTVGTFDPFFLSRLDTNRITEMLSNFTILCMCYNKVHLLHNMTAALFLILL